MKVKSAWHINQLPSHIVLELENGSLKIIRQTPFRQVSEKDLLQYKGHHPAKCNGSMLNPYLMRHYGLEVDLTHLWQSWGQYFDGIHLGYFNGRATVVADDYGVNFPSDGEVIEVNNEGGKWYAYTQDGVWLASHESNGEMPTTELEYTSHNQLADILGLDVGEVQS